jgi:hypothetical protein
MTRSFIHPVRAIRRAYSPRRVASLLALTTIVQRAELHRNQSLLDDRASWDATHLTLLVGTLVSTAETCLEMSGLVCPCTALLSLPWLTTAGSQFESLHKSKVSNISRDFECAPAPSLTPPSHDQRRIRTLSSLWSPSIGLDAVSLTFNSFVGESLSQSTHRLTTADRSRQCAIYPVVLQMLVQAIDSFPLQRLECLEILKVDSPSLHRSLTSPCSCSSLIALLQYLLCWFD